MTDLNLFQQVCIQMFTADLVGTIVGTEDFLQKAMNRAANLAMNQYLGKYGWKITWGPRVWKSPESHFWEGLDNCWMISMAPGVVYPDGSKYDTYVVALAGTAVFSLTDWTQEDFGVNHTVPFDTFTKTFKDGPIPEPEKNKKMPGGAPFSAWGTAWGTYQIVTNTSPDGNPGEKTTILQYLAGLSKDGGDFRVIFTGHSLGGALAPFLSLAVKANSLIPALATTPENILTFPTAGATPGDGPLRDAYNQLFPVSGPGGYQQWNANLYNTLDIVPQAWSTDDSNDRFLDNIVSIYGSLGPLMHVQVKIMVDAAKKRAEASGITYQPIVGNRFTGSAPAHPPSNLLAFIHEVVKQHTKAYHNEVGVGNVVAHAYTTAASTPGVRKKTAREAAHNLPVLHFALLKAPTAPHEGVKDDERVGAPENDLDALPEGNSTVYPYDCILDV